MCIYIYIEREREIYTYTCIHILKSQGSRGSCSRRACGQAGSWGLPNGAFPNGVFAEVPQYTMIYIQACLLHFCENPVCPDPIWKPARIPGMALVRAPGGGDAWTQ